MLTNQLGGVALSLRRGVQLNWRRRAESSVGLWMKTFLVCGMALSLRRGV